MPVREINLIPPDVLIRWHLWRHLFVWTGCLAACLFFILGLYVYQDYTLQSKKYSTISLEGLELNLGKKIEEIKRVQEALQRLDQQQSTLESITWNQSYSRILFTLADIMNEETWLRRLAVENVREMDGERQEGSYRLELSGFSFSNENLGDFINQLSEAPIFGKIALKYARETAMPSLDQLADKSLKVIEFQVECHLTRG